jgi:hypothetical protein
MPLSPDEHHPHPRTGVHDPHVVNRRQGEPSDPDGSNDLDPPSPSGAKQPASAERSTGTRTEVMT